jgi:hypothetical protein
MYACMCVSMYTHTHMQARARAHTHTYIYMHTHTNTYTLTPQVEYIQCSVILIIIDVRYHDFNGFPVSKLVLKTVES